MRWFHILILIFLFGSLFYGVKLWFDVREQSFIFNEFSGFGKVEKFNFTSEGSQFYPNIRFSNKIISYEIESACSLEKREEVERAFDILSDNTVLMFREVIDKPEISILCSNIAPKPEQKNHFIAGEGGPTVIINTSLYSVIFKAQVSLYRTEKCSTPNVAIHEILHALGFEHINNEKDILYPVTNCDQKVGEETIKEINSLYAVDSAPDLSIEKVSANRSRFYLNFDISVSNLGLKKSKPVFLKVYSDGELVKVFEDLGEIEVGVSKSLFVQNIKVPARVGNITFEIEQMPFTEEISLINNKAFLSL